MWRHNPCVSITCFFTDDDGAGGKVTFNIPASSSDIMAFALDIAALLSPLSDCALMKIHISHSVYNDPQSSPVSGSDGSQVGAFFFVDSSGDAYVTTIPGITSSKLEDGIEINLSDGDVAALVAALRDGIDGIQPCSLFGDDLVDILDAYKQVRTW